MKGCKRVIDKKNQMSFSKGWRECSLSFTVLHEKRIEREIPELVSKYGK